MKQKINLKKLNKLNVLQIVDPSENLKEAYLQKSRDSLTSAKILFENKQFADSVSLAYFSMYNSLIALLYKCGIKCENHNASINLMKLIFELDNQKISKAKVERKDKQYYPNFLVSADEVKQAIIETEQFNSELKNFIDKISLADVKKFREKLLIIL